jgi:hypothetical protein
LFFLSNFNAIYLYPYYPPYFWNPHLSPNVSTHSAEWAYRTVPHRTVHFSSDSVRLALENFEWGSDSARKFSVRFGSARGCTVRWAHSDLQFPVEAGEPVIPVTSSGISQSEDRFRERIRGRNSTTTSVLIVHFLAHFRSYREAGMLVGIQCTVWMPLIGGARVLRLPVTTK